MKQKVLLLFSSILLSCGLHAQGEANNWFFGLKAGLTWNTTETKTLTGILGTPNASLSGLPTNISSPNMDSYEGCFSVSDTNGQLLFYSDGIRIWDKNHVVMPNATNLTGDWSSAQSGIIIPHPGTSNQNKYIAVTLGAHNANNLSYSIVDMNLKGNGTNANPLGDVVNNKKNILFGNAKGITGESVTAVQHANKKHFWIIAPGRGTTSYLNVWLVTENGVESSSPVSSYTIPDAIGTGSITSIGYIKFTADGKRFAWGTNSGSQSLYVGEFDNSTGIFSNVKRIPSTLAGTGPYGLEFTASNKYLYLISRPGSGNSQLYIFDVQEILSASNPGTVSRIVYNAQSASQSGNAQLGPDGRMYITQAYQKHIYVVENPEEVSALKIYRLPLDGTSYCGFPSFVSSWFSVEIRGENIFCKDMEQEFTLNIAASNILNSLAYTIWDFGDGTSTIKDDNITSGLQTNRHTYDEAGKYTITIKVYDDSDTEITGQRQTFDVMVSRCVMPVNPNIHAYGEL